MINCKICEKMFNDYKQLGQHIKFTHKLSTQEYYNKYYLINNTCKLCGKPTKFINLNLGYRQYCSHKCQVTSPETIAKCKETKFNNYGEHNYFSTEGLKTLSDKQKANKITRMLKSKQTCIEKYGVEHIKQVQSIKDKSKATYLLHCQENPDFKNNQVAKLRNTYKNNNIIIKKELHKKTYYHYNNIFFDSSWELAYYIWLNDNNINFEYKPKICFEYNYNNETHYYFPDFLVNNKLVEIKGWHFFKEDKMICPYCEAKNELYEAKHQCMINNNVEIITNCNKYLSYIKRNYGKDYLNTFKYKKLR